MPRQLFEIHLRIAQAQFEHAGGLDGQHAHRLDFIPRDQAHAPAFVFQTLPAEDDCAAAHRHLLGEAEETQHAEEHAQSAHAAREQVFLAGHQPKPRGGHAGADEDEPQEFYGRGGEFDVVVHMHSVSGNENIIGSIILGIASDRREFWRERRFGATDG